MDTEREYLEEKLAAAEARLEFIHTLLTDDQRYEVDEWARHEPAIWAVQHVQRVENPGEVLAYVLAKAVKVEQRANAAEARVGQLEQALNFYCFHDDGGKRARAALQGGKE